MGQCVVGRTHDMWLNGASRPMVTMEHYVCCSTCLEVKREDNQNCSVLCCEGHLCTMICTQMWAVLTVLWIGFCHTGFISLCIDYLCLFMCILSLFPTACML